MDTFLHDIRYSLRQLSRRPGLSLAVVLTLALGVGANTAMFSVVHGILLRPLPFPEADRLATVWLTYPQWREREGLREFWDEIPLAYPEYERLRSGTTSLQSVSIYRSDPMTLTGVERPEVITVGSADDALLAVLGIEPIVGRWFSPGEAASGGARLAVLSHSFWRERFGGEPNVLGRAVRLDDVSYAVLGVLPEGFRFGRPDGSAAPDVWVPIGSLGIPLSAGNHAFDAIARLGPGVSLAVAEEETALLLRGDASPESRGARVISRMEQEVAGVRGILVVLWGAVGLLLVIASVNVANLLLGRSIEREGELAIRHALGASRWRLARQLFVESMLLALAGGVAGALLAWWGSGALLAVLPADLPRLHEIRVDLPAFGFALAASAVAGALLGAFPALLAGARATRSRMAGGVHRATTGRGRLRKALVGVQVALALVLLVGAGLLGRTLSELWNVDSGFDREGLLTFQVSLPLGRYETVEAGDEFYARLAESLRGHPGVVDVAMGSMLPLSGGSVSNSVWPASYGPEEGPKPEVERRVVTPAYFDALGISLIRGRPLSVADDSASEPVMLVSAAAARRLWEGRDPIGDRVELDNRWWSVVGVVADVRDRTVSADPRPTVYVPMAQWPMRTRTVLVKTSTPPGALGPAVHRVAHELDPELPITDLQSMERVAAAAVAQERFRALLLGALAMLATTLAAIGLYGVMSHWVARRTRDLGIRSALGAPQGRVIRLVLREAGTTIAIGLVVGALLAVAAARALEAFLFGVTSLDPLTYGGTVALMAATGLLAAFGPAWRATRVDPLEALRHD